MASPLVLALRAIKPQDRVRTLMPPSARRRAPGAPHTRRGPQRDTRSDPYLWHTTMPRPWVLRAKRREANKRARAARKANR